MLPDGSCPGGHATDPRSAAYQKKLDSCQAVAQIGMPLSGSLKRFLSINLGEAEDQRCQVVEPGGRVLTSPGPSLRLVKKCFRTSEKGFAQQPVTSQRVTDL